MTIKEYRDLILIADEVEQDDTGLQAFTVQVFSSPAGDGEKVKSKPVPADLAKYLYRLEHRKLDLNEIIALGETLADLLLPEAARQLFVRSLDGLEPAQGLRLRLRLAPALAEIPWEYLYMQRAGGEKDVAGFLALDPRLSIVRHEALPLSGDLDTAARPRRLLVALASPEAPGYDPLNLEQERATLAQALAEVPGVALDFVENATSESLAAALRDGADIFHFAGHGEFVQTGMGATLRSIVGEGNLVFVTEDGQPAPIPAAQLAVNLRARGVQLAVLGACQTGRRDQANVWSGVAAALMKAEIPAVVAMQYKIWDDSAIAFSRSFYQALVAGLPLDQAVSAGRLAAFNLCHSRREDPELGKFWRDWGVPVLYFRAQQEFTLPALSDPDQRAEAAAGPQIVVDHRFDELGPTGKYKAVEAGVIEGGSIDSYLKVGLLKGQVTQVQAERVTGGEITARGEAQVVEGEWTGVRLGSVGAPAPPESPAQAARDASTCPHCGKPVQADWKFCAHCQQELVPTAKHCQQCGAELTAGARFCQACGRPVD